MVKNHYFYFIAVATCSFASTFFLTLPITKVIATLPVFQMANFFPGQAESYAVVPSLIVIFLITSLLIKLLLKKWRYVITGFIVIAMTISMMATIGEYRVNKYSQVLTNELNEAIEKSKQANITITDFEEIVDSENSQDLKNISFKFNFISNITADMNIGPKVRFNGKHINGNDFIFWYDPTEVKFNGKIQKFNLLESHYYIKANEPQDIEFIFNDLTNNRQFMADLPGHFETGIVFGIHISDPLEYGQGNATEISNIDDITGRAIKENSAGEILHFNSRKYIVRK